VTSEAVNSGGIKEVGVEFELAGDAGRTLPEVQREIEDGGLLFNFEGSIVVMNRVSGGSVKELKGDLEQRIASEVAVGLEVLDKHFEGEILMSVGREGEISDELE